MTEGRAVTKICASKPNQNKGSYDGLAPDGPLREMRLTFFHTEAWPSPVFSVSF